MIPPGTDLTYTWSQAFADLGQIAPIATLTGFLLFALVLDLVLPRSRRAGAVAIAAVVGFAYALGVAVFRWLFASGGYAYHQFATGDNAPLTIATTKFIVGQVVKEDSQRDLAKCGAMVTRCFESKDYVEGRRAFMEKRKPVFTGS